MEESKDIIKKDIIQVDAYWMLTRSKKGISITADKTDPNVFLLIEQRVLRRNIFDSLDY